MKILYAVQATGNGHISRAMELLPYLNQYGQVDVFLSGDNSHLALDAPVKYRSKGLSLYYNCNGALNYWKIAKAFQLSRIRKEIHDLPVEKYDLVINDFEYITAAACAKKKIPSVNFGHQASFQSSQTPRPEHTKVIGEWILKNYARASRYIGLHFKEYDNFILPAIVKKEILQAEPTDKNYFTVYLPSLCERQLKELFENFDEYNFQVFCSETKAPHQIKNIDFIPVNKSLFNTSFIHCTGIITGGGFETPAEALHMGKKLMCIPIKGQYEQECNAAALKELGVTCLPDIKDDFEKHFYGWIKNGKIIKMDYSNSVEKSITMLFTNPAVDFINKPMATPSGLLSMLL